MREPSEFPGGKLIRHLLPEGSIAADGLRAVTHIAEGAELLMRLQGKAVEEAREVADAMTVEAIAEELADVRQVIIDLCTAADIKGAAIRPAALPSSIASEELAVWTARLVECAARVAAAPSDVDDLTGPIGDMCEAVVAITAVLGIRDKVRDQLILKFNAFGGFLEGVVLERTERR